MRELGVDPSDIRLSVASANDFRAELSGQIDQRPSGGAFREACIPGVAADRIRFVV